MDVAYEIVVSDFYSVWDTMFANWEHDSSSLDYFVWWKVFENYIGEDTSKLICVSSLISVSIRDL